MTQQIRTPVDDPATRAVDDPQHRPHEPIEVDSPDSQTVISPAGNVFCAGIAIISGIVIVIFALIPVLFGSSPFPQRFGIGATPSSLLFVAVGGACLIGCGFGIRRRTVWLVAVLLTGFLLCGALAVLAA